MHKKVTAPTCSMSLLMGETSLQPAIPVRAVHVADHSYSCSETYNRLMIHKAIELNATILVIKSEISMAREEI